MAAMECELEKVPDVLARSFLDLCKDMLQYRAWFSVKGSLEVTLDGEHVLLVNIHETVTPNYQLKSARIRENPKSVQPSGGLNTVLQCTASELLALRVKEETSPGALAGAHARDRELTDADKPHHQTSVSDIMDLTGSVCDTMDLTRSASDTIDFIDSLSDTIGSTESEESQEHKQSVGTHAACPAAHSTLLRESMGKRAGPVDSMSGQCLTEKQEKTCNEFATSVATKCDSGVPLANMMQQNDSLTEQISASPSAWNHDSNEINSEACVSLDNKLKTVVPKKSANSSIEKQKLKIYKLGDVNMVKVKRELVDSDHCEDAGHLENNDFDAIISIIPVKTETVGVEGNSDQTLVSIADKQQSSQSVTALTHNAHKAKTLRRSKTKKKNYSCTVCGKIFKHITAYRKHSQKPHKDINWRSKKERSVDTDEECSITENFDQYLNGENPRGKRYYKCPTCGRQFVQMKRFKKHIMNHHADQKQQKVKGEDEDIDPQYIINQGTDDKTRYKCPSCGKEFRYFVPFKKHMKTPHGEKKYVCGDCGKGFKNKSNFAQHMVSHTGERPYKCKLCAKSFRQSASLKVHQRVHTGEKPYKCDICGRMFNRSNSLTTHMLVHTERPKVHACSICSKAFTTKHILKQHIRTHTGTKRYTCDICGKNVTNIATHKLTHTGEKNFMCTVCGRSFSQLGNLQSHQRTHTGEKPYPCPLCELKFAQKATLRSHLVLHSGEKNFICSTCGKAFSHSFKLKAHNRIHAGIKPHVCSVCNKAYVDPCNLRVHMRIHTGEKPYSCDFCGKAFNQSISLKIHRRIHTGEKPYSCDLCGASFSQLAGLKSHKLTHQAEKQVDKT